MISRACSSVAVAPEEYKLAVQALQQGGIVAYPTETFYGLAVDPENAQAVSSLYRLKQRETTKAVSLLIPDLTILSSCITEMSGGSQILADAFWPGPLTLIFDAADRALQRLRKNDNTLAFRISSHPVAHKFCTLCGGPITASSANISGEPALATAAEVRALWGDKLAYILDGGTTPGKAASTIMRCEGMNCTILRQGVISYGAIRDVLPGHYSICKE